jgi:hypothetical protein
MPAVRLGGTAVAIRKYDVVGQDSVGKPGFVGHVGLAGENRDLFGPSDELLLVHMRPPLEIGASRHAIDCAGTAGLTIDEMRQIGLFIDEMESEYEAARLRSDRRRQYVIAPHVDPVSAPDGTVIYHRSSCAGFVIEAYGIPGEGPWPVVLAGYVINALVRPEEEIRRVPHTARLGDEFFPSRRLESSARSS